MKLTKKLLSIVLSVVLVATTIPMSVFAATSRSADDSNAVSLKEAITAYEDKMDGTLYTNMAAAYNAYVEANKAYDSYVYGDASLTLSTYTNALTTATANMEVATNDWAEYSGISSVVPTFSASSATLDTLDRKFYANILYSSGVSGTAKEDNSPTGYVFSSSNNKLYVSVYYSANTVVLIDGVTTPLIPTMFSAKASASSERYVYTVYPTESSTSTVQNSDVYMINKNNRMNDITWDWRGGGAGGSGVYTCDFTYAVGRSSYVGQDYELTNGRYSDAMNNGGTKGKYKYLQYFASCMEVNPDLSFGGEGYKTISNLAWRYYGGSNNTPKTTDLTDCGESSSNIYAINLKDMLTAYKSSIKVFTSTVVSNYKNGGLADYLATWDTVNSFSKSDLTALSTSSNVASDVATLGNKIKAITTGLNTTPVADTTTASYSAMRSAIEKTTSTYNSSSYDKYTTDSWEAFVAAYDVVKDEMANIITNGYTCTNGEALALALTDSDNKTGAYEKLEVNFTPADTTELEMIIDDAVVAINNSDYFTSVSFKAGDFSYNVSTAKREIWGSEESYKDEASKISSDQQDTVETWSTTIGEALMALEINTDAPVSSAKNYSMQSAIEYAATFDSSDYSNYSDVTEAVSNAQLFNPQLTTREAGAVSAKIEKYISYVNAIIRAINALHPAFSKMTNGTVANSGSSVTTTIVSKEDSGNWQLAWTRNSGQIYFRTSHTATTFDLGGAEFGFKGSTAFDNMLDGMCFADLQSDSTGYITNINMSTKSSGWDLTADQCSTYPGGLAITNNGGTFRVSNCVVSSSSGSNTAFGKYTEDDATTNGTTDITDKTFVYDTYLTNIQGTLTPTGGIVAKSGTTYFNSDYTLTVSKEASKNLTASTIPSLTSFNISQYFGMTYYYKVTGGAFKYGGYAHDVAQYNQTASVINVSYLFDLINTVDALNYLEYTKSSWDNLQTALSAAKDSMNYENMTADAIAEECITRYTNLYNAWKALETPLSNDAIDDAVNDAMSVYLATNSAGIYSTTSWAAFEEAYTTAYNTVHNDGIYTEINIRNVDPTDENKAAIEKIAQDLIDAFNALQKVANFTVLTNAVSELMAGIADNTYSVTSLQALSAKLSAFQYLNYTDEQKGVTYDDEQDALDAEAEEIKAITLDQATVDASSLDATVEKVKKDYTDPDAWDENSLADVINQVQNINIYEDVDVYGYNVIGIKYETQADLDATVSSILSGIVPQNYTVYVDGVAQGTYEYGEQAEITFPNDCAIYYAYTSNTATNTAKYYTTDHIIKFIVKGNTYLTTKSATDTSTVKVTFVNGLKNKTYEVDYVTTGSSIQLPTAPSVAFYDFVGYTVNGKDYEEGDSVEISKATTIVANYEITDDASSTISFVMSTGTDAFGTVKQALFTTNYNTLFEIKESSLITAKATTKGTVTIGGTETTISTLRFNRYNNKDVPIYAYAVVAANEEGEAVEEFKELVINNGIYDYDNCDSDGNPAYTSNGYDGIATIVTYGSDYSFYTSDNVLVMPLSEEETNILIETGIANVDSQGASAGIKEEIVDAGTKYSMIGTYGLPEGATLVEAGILFSKDQTAELTFANAGNGTVYRMKSSQHTVGNQFVVSVKKPSTSYDVKYMSYVIYKLNGNEYTAYSNEVANTFNA